ncbi:hypothetical protein ACN38_g12247, partial [Penicillium nordicum]
TFGSGFRSLFNILMLLSSDRFILMTLAGLCRRPSPGCEWHEACLGGNGNGLRSRHSYAPLRKQTVLAWVLPLSARSRTKGSSN